jgi:hypothetical protein
VPKYDAFGREIGEDTLSGLGDSGSSGAGPSEPATSWTPEQVAEAASYEAAATPAPAAAPTPTPTPAPAPASTPMQSSPARFQVPITAIPGAPRARRRAGGLGCLISLLVLAAVIAAPIILVVSIAGEAGDVIDSVKDSIDSGTGTGGDGSDAAPPTGIAGRSLIAPANFEQALTQLEGANVGRPMGLRLAPDRVSGVLVKGSKQTVVNLTYDGQLTRVSSPGGVALRTVKFSAIDRRAPARLVRGSAARFKLSAAKIDYLVLSSLPGVGTQWVAYFKGGAYVMGDAHGKVVRRIN